MEPKLKVIWDNLLDQLEKNTLNNAYLNEKLEPFFNYLIFKTTDDLNNNLLNYALIYKNLTLLEFIFNKINFNSLENEVKDKITEDLFSIFISLTKNLRSNLHFLVKFLELIKEKSFKEIGNIYINQNTFKIKIAKKFKESFGKGVEEEEDKDELANKKAQSLFANLDLDDKFSFKLINPLIKFFVKDCGVDKKHVFVVRIKQIYDEKYSNLIWKQMNLKKLDTKKEFYILHNVSYNILHEAIRLKKWHFFIDINIFILKDLLFTPDATKATPFHQIFTSADHLTISHLIKECSQTNLITEEIMKQTHSNGKNLIHLLIDNKRLETQDLKQILILLKSVFNLKGLLASADKHHWIPLSYYFLSKFKVGCNFNEWIKNHLEINDLLMPSSENFNFFSYEFTKEDFSFYLCTYPLVNLHAKEKDEFLKNFEIFAKNYTIFNNKFLQLAFHKNSEDLLLFFLKKIPDLELNTFLNDFDFGLTRKTHIIEKLLCKNWVSAISLFFTKNPEKFFIEYKNSRFYKYLVEKHNIFQVFFENNGADTSNSYFYFSYSVMNELIIGLNAIKNEAFYSKLADLIFKKMHEVLQSFSLDIREKILMNINIQIVAPKKKNSLHQIQDSITLADLFELDDNQMIELFENQIKSIKPENFPYKFKIYVIKVLTKKNLVSFFEASSLQKFFKFPTNDEALENEINSMFESLQFNSSVIMQLYKEIYKNPLCLPYIFNSFPKLFLILWEGNMINQFENLIGEEFTKLKSNSKNGNILFIEHFLNYSLEQYLTNYHLTDNQKNKMLDFIKSPRFLTKNIISLEKVSKYVLHYIEFMKKLNFHRVLLKNSRIVEEFLDKAKLGLINSDMILQLQSLHSYLFSVSTDEKERMMYISIIDNYMKKLNYDEVFTTDKNSFQRFILNLKNIMTIEIKAIPSKETLNKFQEFIKHGFIFKCSGPLLMKYGQDFLEKYDKNILTNFLRYQLITGNNILEYLCEDKSNESNNMVLAQQIVTGSGKWQIFMKNKSKQTILDFSSENNSIVLMSTLMMNITFMKFYEELPNKNQIFFYRLNRMTPPYIKSSYWTINVNKETIKDSLSMELKGKIFQNQKENHEVFSKNISLLLSHYSEDIDRNIKEILEKIREKTDINKLYEVQNLFLIKFQKNFVSFKNKKYNKDFPNLDINNILIQNNNFVLRAFPFLDIDTIKQIPMSCFTLLFTNIDIFSSKYHTIVSLLDHSIKEKQPEKVQFLKHLILNEIFTKEENIIKQFGQVLLRNPDILVNNEYEFFLEILKKISPLSDKSFLRICYIRCLKTLYYAEGRKFKEFLKWAFLNEIDVSLKSFFLYITGKTRVKDNYLAIFLYLPVNKLNFSIFSNDKIFEEVIKENSKELSEIFQENPQKFYKLGLFKEICINSLTNKLRSFLNLISTLKPLPSNQNSEDLMKEEFLKGLNDLIKFNYQYKITKIGVESQLLNKTINNGLNLYFTLFKNFTNLFDKDRKISLPKTFDFTEAMKKTYLTGFNFSNATNILHQQEPRKELNIDKKEIDQIIKSKQDARSTFMNNRLMKSNKAIEKSYTTKKRIEYFEINKKSAQFELNHYCVFNGLSESDIVNWSKFGKQDPIVSLKIMIEYFIWPMIKKDFNLNIEEIENFLLLCSPLEFSICEEILSTIKKNLTAEYDKYRYSLLILQIFYLTLKFNEVRLTLPKRRILKHQEYSKETTITCKLIIEKYLNLEKIDDIIESLIFNIILKLQDQEMYDVIYDLYETLSHQLSLETLNKIGITENFCKAFLKPVLLTNNYELFKKFLNANEEKVESFYKIAYSSSNELIPNLKIKIPMNKIIQLEIVGDAENRLPNRIFTEKYSDYFLDLYHKEFNFNQMIISHINENGRFVYFKSQILKEKNHYSLLEFSILKGFTKVFEYLLEKNNQNIDFEINFLIVLLLENGKMSIFKSMMNLLFPDDSSKIFDFLLNNDLMMRVASIGNELFLIQLLKEYIIPLGNKKLIPENKLIFSTNKKDMTLKNMNIFHYIAYYRMTNFMYIFLDYLMAYKFESDGKKMKYFLEEFLLMKNEELNNTTGEINQRTPIFYALKNKFYEMMNLCDINDIAITTTNQKESILTEIGLEMKGISYFSRYLMFDNLTTFKLDKPNFFYDKFQNYLNLLSKLKSVFNTNKKIKDNFELNYILEAVIFGKKLLELDNSLMNPIKTFLKGSKAFFYLFFEIFPLEIKNFESNDLIFSKNEAFIFYVLDKFFLAVRKSNESLSNAFELCKKISHKNKNVDLVNQIFIHTEINSLIKSLQQKLKQSNEVKTTQDSVIFKLDSKKIYDLLVFSYQHRYNYLICYLMNLYSSDFLMVNEDSNPKSELSFFFEYLVFDGHLSYRLLKILEKSSVYLLVEKEFNVYIEKFYAFEGDSNNLKALIESFKVLFLLICEEGYYSHSIFQITNCKSSDEAFLSLFKKFGGIIKNNRMIKTYLDTLLREIQTLDYEEFMQYNYFVKNGSKQDALLKTLKPLLNFYLDETNNKSNKKYRLNAETFEKFIFNAFDQKLSKINLDCKHIGVFVSLGISFILTCLEGFGVYEELASEFENCEFIFYFDEDLKSYNLIKQENLKVFHVNINEQVYYDEPSLALTYKFSQESYENLKSHLKELTFQEKSKIVSTSFFSKMKIKISHLASTFPPLKETQINFNWNSIENLPMDIKELIIGKLLDPSTIKKNSSNLNFVNYLGFIELLNSLESYLESENRVKHFKIDDMFAPHNMQNITHQNTLNISNFNISQRVEGEISYQLEIQPDATYQVKYKKAERKKSFSHTFEDIIFSEFYELQYASNMPIELIYNKYDNFMSLVNIDAFYDTLMRVLISYDKLTYAKIKNTSLGIEKDDELSLNWIYSIDDKSNIVFCKDLFPLYLVMKLRSTMNDFENQIQTKMNLAANFTPCRINILSFCDVFISHILKCMKNSQEATINKYLHNSLTNLFNMINSILDDSILKSIIYRIIRQITLEQSNVLKIIRGIYIQFREKDITCLHEKENIDDLHLKGLDKLFRFSKTNYFIYKYMLVIEFQVVKMHESFDEKEIKDCTYQEKTNILNDYVFMITNKFDFYECIFNNEQIITNILGKLELENKLLEISKNLSNLTSKIMTISINFDNLLNLLKKEFYSIKMNIADRYQKIDKYDQLWKLILNIKDFFLSRAEKDLINETKEPNYDENFHIIYLQMIMAYHDKKSLNEMLMKNYRIYSISDNFDNDFKTLSNSNALSLLQIPINQESMNDNLFKMSFLFQTDIGYFMLNSKVGEVYIVGMKNEKKKKTEIIEITSKNDGKIYYINLYERKYIDARQLLGRRNEGTAFINIENMSFAFLVTKKWPDMTTTTNFKNIGITDSNMRAIFIHHDYLKKMCEEIYQLDSESFEHSSFPLLFYRSSNNVKSELTVSNLIQFVPNVFTYDFEIIKENKEGSQTELPQLTLPQSTSFMRAQSLMQSMNKSLNHRTIKINMNIENNSVRCEDLIRDSFNLSSKYEINLIYYFYINTFIKRFNRLLKSVNYVKYIKETGLDLKIEFDREIDDKSSEYEEKILVILEAILDNIFDAFETFFKIGNIKDYKLFKLLSMLNYEIDNEHNPINYLIAGFIFKYLKEIVIKFDLNSPNKDLLFFSPENRSLIVSVKFSDIENSKEKSITFLSAEEIFDGFCLNILKKELNMINESFSGKNGLNTDVVYDNRNLQYNNSNLVPLVNFLNDKKYFKKVEFINKLKQEDIERERDNLLVCLALFEYVLYLSISNFKVINILSKTTFAGNSNLKIVLEPKNMEVLNKEPLNFYLSIQLDNLNFMKLITNNFNTLQTLLTQPIAESQIECSISYLDTILYVKKDTAFLKIKVNLIEELNSYMNRMKIPTKNIKLRSILINSSTLETFLSSSINSEPDDKFFEINFEKSSAMKPQKYFLNTYVNNHLIYESQILIVKNANDNNFYPLINNLFNFSKNIFLGDSVTFLINNSPIEETSELNKSMETPKKYNPFKKNLTKDLTEYIDFNVEFKPLRINCKPINFKFSEMPNHRPYNTSENNKFYDRAKLFVEEKDKEKWSKEERKKYKVKKSQRQILKERLKEKIVPKSKKNGKKLILKKPKKKFHGFFRSYGNILTKWLNSNLLFVHFSLNIVAEVTFTFLDRIPEPHVMVYNLKDFEFETNNPLKYLFETKREIFYPFTKIYQVCFEDGIQKAIINEKKEEKNQEKEKKIEINEESLLQTIYFRKFMEEMNSTNFNLFYDAKQRDIIHMDISPELLKEILKENEKELLEKEEIKSLMTDNILSVIKDSTSTEKLYSMAGKTRKEWIKMYDHDKNEILLKEKIPFEILFVNNISREIIFKGTNTVSNDKTSLEVKWTPFIKGLYKMYVNGIFAKNYEIAILANYVAKNTSKIDLPDIKTMGFYDKFNIMIQYRDQFGNIFGELDKKLLTPNMSLSKLVCRTQKKGKFKTNFSEIDAWGKQRIDFSFENPDIENLESEEHVIQIFIMNDMVKEIQVKIDGFSLEKRIQKLYLEMHKSNSSRGSYHINTKRMYFVEELKNLENIQLRKNLNICFEGEGGIDAGGLKREYYDMVGSCMKDANYHFFIQNPKTLRYTIHPEIFKIKESAIYMKVFGKLLANSIFEKEILGIELAHSLFKFIFDIPIEFEDLKDELDEVTFKNYENMGKMTEADLKSLEQSFTIYSQGKEVELKENGANIQVNTANVKEYLEIVTKYHLQTKKINELNAFKEGFESVIEKTILLKFMKLEEISSLTLGENLITPDNLINVTEYHGGNAVIINFFKQYLKEAKTEVLEGFVKFATGSRSLPYDTKAYKISVSFHKTDVKKLPIAHTCSRAIEVPCYTSFEDMRKKLDVAFLYGSEGFSFG